MFIAPLILGFSLGGLTALRIMTKINTEQPVEKITPDELRELLQEDEDVPDNVVPFPVKE